MTTAPTRTELDDQLATAQQRLDAAREQLGASAIDGSGEKAATKKVRDAEQDIGRIEAMIGELERREQREAEQTAEASSSAVRLKAYRWAADFARRAARLVEARSAAAAAEAHLKALGNNRRVHGLNTGRARGVVDGELRSIGLAESDLDYLLFRELPEFRAGKQPHDLRDLTPERLEELAARADELAAAEERGEDIAVKGTEWQAERQARKLAARAAARAEEEAELQRKREEQGQTTAPQPKAERDDNGVVLFTDNPLEAGPGSNIPEVMAGIERQQAGFGDPR